MTSLLQRLQFRLTYTTDVVQRFQSQIARMDAAQAIGLSRPASPRLAPPVIPPPLSSSASIAASASASNPHFPSLNLPHNALPLSAGPPYDSTYAAAPLDVPWESAFELQDIFSDWPFDFAASWAGAGDGLGGTEFSVQQQLGEPVSEGQQSQQEAGHWP